MIFIVLQLTRQDFSALQVKLDLNPRLCIWNSKTLEEAYTATAPMTKGIKHVAFSKDGKYLACSDMSDDYNLSIFDCKTKLKPRCSLDFIA